MLPTDNRKTIDHPIINFYSNEVSNDTHCDDMDYEACEYEAN